MGIDELKRWHWAIIGALLGLALAYAWTSMGSDSAPENIRRFDQREFERDLTLRDDKSGEPFIKDIVVYPQIQSFRGPVNIVDYKRLARDRQGQIGWLKAETIVDVPFRPAVPGRVEKIDQNLTVQQYLASVSKELGLPVSFKSAWWMIPRNAMMLGALGGLVVIGGVWPTLLDVMMGAGIGPKKRDPKDKDRKLPRLHWFKRADTPRPAATAAAIAGAGLSHVQDVADAYEQTLAASAVARSDSAAQLQTAEAPVRKLDGGPVESTAVKNDDQDEVEVKNKEFYPVLIHHHKPKEDPDHKIDPRKS